MLKSVVLPKMSRSASNILNQFRRSSSASVKIKETAINSPSTKYNDFIANRMLEANHSILVQVESDQLYKNAYHHCRQFGEITTAIAYNMTDDRKFLLLEYCNKDSVSEILANADFRSNLIPWKNRYLSYRNTNSTNVNTDSIVAPIQQSNLIEPLDFSNLQPMSTFDDQIMHVYNHFRLNDLQQRLRCLAALQVENVLTEFLHEMFPNGKIVPFGSSFHGFGTFHSNLDLAFQYPNKLLPCDESAPLEYFNKDFAADDEQIEHGGRQIKCIAWMLDYFMPGSSQIAPMAKARPELARYFDAYTQCRLDVSVNYECQLIPSFYGEKSRYGVKETELLYALGLIDPRVRPFVLLVHKWAAAMNQSKLGRGKFFSIQITYLALRFLQQTKQPLLPPLGQLYSIENIGPTVSIDIKTIEFKSNNTSTLGELFREFLEYYATFEVNKYAVSLRLAEQWLKPTSKPVEKHSNPLKTPPGKPMYMEQIFFSESNFAENIADIDYDLFLIAIKSTMKVLDETGTSDNNKAILPFLL